MRGAVPRSDLELSRALNKHVGHKSSRATYRLPGTNKFYRISSKGAVNLRGSSSSHFLVSREKTRVVSVAGAPRRRATTNSPDEHAGPALCPEARIRGHIAICKQAAQKIDPCANGIPIAERVEHVLAMCKQRLGLAIFRYVDNQGQYNV